MSGTDLLIGLRIRPPPISAHCSAEPVSIGCTGGIRAEQRRVWLQYRLGKVSKRDHANLPTCLCTGRFNRQFYQAIGLVQ